MVKWYLFLKLLEKLLRLHGEGQEFAIYFLDYFEQFNCSERSVVQFLKQNAFFTSSWRFLRSDTLEQLEFTSLATLKKTLTS